MCSIIILTAPPRSAWVDNFANSKFAGAPQGETSGNLPPYSLLMGKSISRRPNLVLAYCGAPGRPHQQLSCLGSPGAICGPILALGCALGCPLGPNSPISAPGQICGSWGNVRVEQKLSISYLFDARSSQLPRVPGTQVARALSIDLGH